MIEVGERMRVKGWHYISQMYFPNFLDGEESQDPWTLTPSFALQGDEVQEGDKQEQPGGLGKVL